MGATATNRDRHPQRPLAARLDPGSGRFHQHRQVNIVQQVRSQPRHMTQAVVFGGDLLPGVEHVGHVPDGVTQIVRTFQGHRDPALHVTGPEAVDAIRGCFRNPVDAHQRDWFAGDYVAGTVVAGSRNGVQVAAKQHPLVAAPVGSGYDCVTDSVDEQMAQRVQRLLHQVRQPRFCLRLARDVNEGHGELRDVKGEVKGVGAGHLTTVACVNTLLQSPAAGIGLATFQGEELLDVWYPQPSLTKNPVDTTSLGAGIGTDPVRHTRSSTLVTTIDDLSAPPVDAADVYLRLHLLSHRLVAPRTVNLDGIFGLLPNVAWTTLGPVSVPELPAAQLRARTHGGGLHLLGVDKFPRMLDYVVPSGVRIADAGRVRLGAHLAAGTTVMHEGFCNFNAGTLGASMVEGRISAGVVVGDGSDIGGGASIMGTLSGGGSQVISIGRGCLVGANAGIGISLGDGCVVEAGCYVTAGSKLTMPDGEVLKGSALSGADNLLFRRNSVTGALEVLPRTGSWGGLNEHLHVND